MANILGLDLGSNSIGWCIIDDDSKQIVNNGCVIFQEGVNRDTKGNEVSKSEARRNFRQVRRQLWRKKLRKRKIAQFLQDRNMMPKSEELQDWLRINPYEIRSMAISEEIGEKEFGRIIYHFAQRRGFQSSRKGQSKETKIDKSDEKTGRKGIVETENQISNFGKTLGAYLYDLHPNQNEPFERKERIRNRNISRAMVINELNEIWAMQSKYKPNVFNDELKTVLLDNKKGLLFFQRELKSNRHLTSNCRFEKNKKVVSISSFIFEEFRAYQFINNIEYGNRNKLNESQRAKVFEILCSKDQTIKFGEIVKKLKLDNESFNYDLETKISVCPTHCHFAKIFNKDYFVANKVSDIEQLKEWFWNVMFFAKDDDWLRDYAVKNWNLNEKQIEALLKFSLKDKFASVSRKACRNILPFLKAGSAYNIAVLMGGVANAFGDKYHQLDEKDKEYMKQTILDISSQDNKEGELIEKIKNFLAGTYDLSDKQLSKLYHHSQEANETELLDKLPPPPNLRNPIVNKALSTLRKLINALIDEYGKPDKIHIEMARELKLPKKKRIEMQINNREREKQNELAKVFLATQGLKPSKDNVQKYLLYKEIETKYGHCVSPYSGKTLSLHQVFSEDGNITIEHIIPYSVSLDDSFANKTLCERDINIEKGDNTPFQYFGGDEVNWKIMTERAFKVLPFRKAKRFVSEIQPSLENFIQRQLNDTRYISKEARKYLSQICPNTQVSTGQVTSVLRRMWGLNGILNKEAPEKTRTDHRHHIIDAITIACVKKSFIQSISSHSSGKRKKKDNFPLPWESFFLDVGRSISKTLVFFDYKEKLLNRIKKTIRKNGRKYKSFGISARGELHGQTFFGKRYDNKSQKCFYHSREKLENITKKSQVEKIADQKIREIIINRLKELNVDINSKYSVPKNAFFRVNEKTGLKEPLIFLKNKRGKPVPIFKVRVKETKNKVIHIRPNMNQWVETSGNYLTAIYKNDSGQYFETTVSLFDAVKNKLAGKPVVKGKLPDGYSLETTLQKNDMFLIGIEPEKIDWDSPDQSFLHNFLYRVQKISELYYTFRKHTASTILYDDEMVRIASFHNWIKQRPIKVKIDILGRIKPAKQ